MMRLPKVLLNLLALVGVIAAVLGFVTVLQYQEGDNPTLYVAFWVALAVGAALVIALLISFVISVLVDIWRWRKRV